MCIKIKICFILNENSDGILRRGGAILIGIDEFRKINEIDNVC